ncbi:MAG: nucleotidyltransferase family protein [Paludibacteraceae bacterium]|nr:nucleotidyltransferase family protein [Prevotellaceae bacterium]
MDVSQSQFLELNRAALWRKVADVSLFERGADWKRIFQIAGEQAALGVTYSGMMTLPENLRPDRMVLLRWYGLVVKIENVYHKHLDVLAHIYGIYAELDLCPVLLKGLGVAALYPEPERRQCGDIDLYAPEEDAYERMKSLLAQRNLLGDDDEESFKHYHFRMEGVVIEIHRKIAKMLSPFYERRFRQLTAEAMAQRQTVRIGEVEVALSPSWFDAIFLLIHMSIHLAEQGIGVRQISDWSLFLSAHTQNMDRDMIIRNLKRLGLTYDWKLFSAFAVKYLGLDRSAAVIYDGRFEGKAGRLAEMIFVSGNFGKATDAWSHRPPSFLARKIYALRVHVRYFLCSFRVAPVDAIWNILFNYPQDVWSRLKKGE